MGSSYSNDDYFASGGVASSGATGRGSTIAVGGIASPAATEVQPPNSVGPAQGALGELCGSQKAAVIGQAVPIVFARRVGDRGGVFIAPPATDARYENDASNELTAKYHLILGDGPMGSVQVRDVFQCTCRIGSFTQTYNRRAGNWDPGNFLVERDGYTLQNVPNYCGSKGTCEGMTTMSYENTYPDGSGDWALEVQIFIREGRTVTRLADSISGPSSNFADLFKLAMEISAKLPADMIDTTRLQTAALFLDANQFYCDIVIKEAQNLEDFISANAPYFLVRETRVNGKRGLRPLLPIDDAYAIKTDPISWEFEFDEDFILPGSLQVDYTPLEQRKPKLMQAMWRQQPGDTFGIIRTAEVGYANDRSSDNVEQHDMSLFCSHELHAVRAMAYKRARQKWSTHTISWACRPEVYNRILEEGDIVRVTYQRNASDGSTTTHDYLYELDQIEKTSTGEIKFQATHFPVDAAGRSLVALTVVQATAQGHDYAGDVRTGIDCDDNTTRVDFSAVNTISIPEDGSYTFAAADFGFSDSDEDALAAVSITTLPTAGALTLDGNVVEANDLITVADIIDGKLVYTPAPDADETAYTSFSFQVDDAPVGSYKTISIPEDGSYTFAAADFGFPDSDAVNITTLPTAGVLTLDGNVVEANDLITVADINDGKLVYTPAPDANGTAFSFQIKDNRSTDTSVPAEVGQVIGPGVPPFPPSAPPSLPPAPLPPGDPLDEPPPAPPPGGYTPPTPAPDPQPTEEDDPVDPCEPICTTQTIYGDVGGPAPTCPLGTTTVGTITAHFPEGDQTAVLCQTCVAPEGCPPLPPVPTPSGAGVWKLESTSVDRGSTLAVGRLIEIPEPSTTSKRIVQVNTAVDVSDVITWTPDTDNDTEFSVESRSVAKKDISYWDPENCPRSAATASGTIYVRTYDSGGSWTGSQTRISSRGLLRVDCDNETATESNTLTYIGPGQIRDWWSVSALPGTVSGGILVTSLPIPDPDLSGPS